MAVTDADVAKIRKALKPDFDAVEQNVHKALKPDFDRLDQKLDQKIDQAEKNIKKYVHEGIDATVEGIDNLMQENDFDSRIKDLENIHPQGAHTS